MKKKAFLAAVLFIVAVVAGYFALEAYANVKLKEKIDRRFKKLPYATSYSYFHYNLARNDLEFKDFTLSSSLFSLKLSRLYIDLPVEFRKKGFPPYLKVEVRGGDVKINLPLLDELLGESSFRFNLDGWYRFKGSKLDASLSLNVRNVADFYLGTLIDNLSYPVVERFFEGRTTVRALVNRGRLVKFHVVFRNRGIYGRFLNYAARQEGMTPEKIKKELFSMIEKNFHKDDFLYRRVGEALEEFIRRPTCLKLEVLPPQPVSLKALKELVVSKPNIKAVVEELGLRLTVCH